MRIQTPSEGAEIRIDMNPLPIDRTTADDEVVAVVRAWVEEHVPRAWREAAAQGGAAAIRAVRSRDEYAAWYPVFGCSGLVAPTWPREYGGLDVAPATARLIERDLAPFNLGRLNPLGLNLAAPALFAHGTEQQRCRFLPPIVTNAETWCQLFSEPGAGSDLASLATRATRDGDEWHVTGSKVWTTWAHRADFGVLLARTDPDAPKHAGITYFLLGMHQPGVTLRPLRDLTGATEFNEVHLDGASVPDRQRVGDVGEGWRVAQATLSGERQMVSGTGSGGVDRIGGSSVERLVGLARERVAHGARLGAVLRDRLAGLVSEDRIRGWTNERVRAGLRAGRPPGAASSVGKVHAGELNQRTQLLATEMLGADALAWSDAEVPYEVHGMLRSRANTIEGGTTEVNKNVIAERVLGLPREPDTWRDRPWREVPRS
jgi:alkylation response protein AidB-like acyl-CoA dehydrogenase